MISWVDFPRALDNSTEQQHRRAHQQRTYLSERPTFEQYEEKPQISHLRHSIRTVWLTVLYRRTELLQYATIRPGYQTCTST